MTTEDIELTFVTTAKDWKYVQWLLYRLVLWRDSKLLYCFTHKNLVVGAMTVVGSGLSIFIVIIALPKLIARVSAETFDGMTLFFLILVGWALWTLGRDLWKLTGNTSTVEGPFGTGREGVNWGLHQVRATAECLTVHLSHLNSRYKWDAILDLKKTNDFLFLQLTPRSAIAIPRKAFESKSDEISFSDFVRSRIGSPAADQ